MASGSLLRKLIKTGAEGNLEAFKNVSEEVIREERSKNHHLLANDLERILYGRSNNIGGSHLTLIKQVPKDKERGLPLLYIKEPVRRLEDVVLSDENSSLLDDILQEHHHKNDLKAMACLRLIGCFFPVLQVVARRSLPKLLHLS